MYTPSELEFVVHVRRGWLGLGKSNNSAARISTRTSEHPCSGNGQVWEKVIIQQQESVHTSSCLTFAQSSK